MSLNANGQVWLAKRLLDHAVGRLSRRWPEWAQAMASEAAALPSDWERLQWAFGCVIASYRTPEQSAAAPYPAALLGGVAGMVIFQWSADESLGTLGFLSLIALGLGVIRPDRFILSGVSVGLVVAAVNAFEAVSGIRPAYETLPRHLWHSGHWAILAAPALLASAAGARLGQRLRRAARP